MSQDKEIIKKLFAAVSKQQQILTKLAQSVEADTSKDITEQMQGVLAQITGGKGGFVIEQARGPLSDNSVRIQMRMPAGHPKGDAVVNLFKTKVSQLPGFEGMNIEITKLFG